MTTTNSPHSNFHDGDVLLLTLGYSVEVLGRCLGHIWEIVQEVCETCLGRFWGGLSSEVLWKVLGTLFDQTTCVET